MTNVQGNRGWAAVLVAAILMMLAAAIAAPAQTFTTLHSFDWGDGRSPEAALIQATDGNLYGTTTGGGAQSSCREDQWHQSSLIGCGTLFKITLSGALTTLHIFGSQANGEAPVAALVQGADGNFYGTTQLSGAGSACYLNVDGCGTVFRVTTSGTLTTLYSFCSQSACPDGAYPDAALVQANDGNFYGTTFAGGANNPADGTVFKITPSGTLTTLYSFGLQASDGASPKGGLVQATDGNFYGTTSYLGANLQYGTVFKITPSGTLTTLYSFCSQSNCTDGANPLAGLVQGTDGNFYGTTSGGGASGGGAVFKISPSGTLTTLYSFCSQGVCPDGRAPYAGLLQANDGNFYGTTEYGGANYSGTVFKITPSGTLTTLYSFCSQTGCTDGRSPEAALVQDTNGIFYGTTSAGGANADGTVFSLSVGLGPFVETQPAFGKAGKVIKILGTNLAGATSVTFNGTPALFKVISASEIGATVPAGATTGPVQVVTPSGTLTSNMNFRVRP